MNPATLSAAKSLRILLLDDSEVMLDLVGEMLRAIGVAEVLTAADGERGLALLDAQAAPPDALLCDLHMPGMDGIEFLRHIAARAYGGKVILFSGTELAVLQAAERLARAHGLNLGGILEKPVAAAALAAMLAATGRNGMPQSGDRPVPQLSAAEVRTGLAVADPVELVYQPKVAPQTRRVCGVECLARWRHPERGLLPPSAFIDVVEHCGLIDEFTLTVFRKAVAQQHAWQRQGHAIKLNINLSMDNLRRLDLPETLAGIARAAGVAAHDIVLELTESRLMSNLRLSLDILIRLRLMGFGLSIDDFGTGYSTMENLKQLPFSELKVDRLFVNGAAADASARAILESNVSLGRSFGLNLVAEGVETQEDWDLIAAAGCDEAQGYFIARPMAAQHLIDWITHWKTQPERKTT